MMTGPKENSEFGFLDEGLGYKLQLRPTELYLVIPRPLHNYPDNRIYNKILDRDWFSAPLFVT